MSTSQTPGKLSVIVRYHQNGSLTLLKEALFSVVCSTYLNIEVIVSGKNLTESTINHINDYLDKLKILKPNVAFILLNAQIGDIDGRSLIMNRGISVSSGEFLSFLDYDDIVYQNGYEKLIHDILETKSALSAGGCRTAFLQPLDDDSYYTLKKEFLSHKDKNILHLAMDNFIPIHSFVVNRSTIPDEELHFSETLDRLEDYDFILRVCSVTHGRISLNLLQTPVCEYRIRTDGSNSTSLGETNPSQEKLQQWNKAREQIRQTKDRYELRLPYTTVAGLISKDSISSYDLIEIRLAKRLSKKIRGNKCLFFLAKFLYKPFVLLNSLIRRNR